LTKDELLTLPLFEETKANNLIKAIRSARKVSLDRLIIGLGIPHVGEETAFILSTRFGTLKHLENAKEAELSKIDGIGPIIGKSVALWFKDPENEFRGWRNKYGRIMDISGYNGEPNNEIF